ncbi:protein of unknown function [Candidatus Nitrotoga arctica]|uniref:Uncharacterized protein n=1 Tax=Candidatus Nitrotoga arctica TaxID=453162 RepID=A0ABM8YY47_9PROT|nr:protein of unknown function [Candidatus Nitrotoga arctica]
MFHTIHHKDRLIAQAKLAVRMAQTAAHLTGHVSARLPVRQ